MGERIVGGMNIRSIKSEDPYAKDIVAGSAVAVYTFNPEKNAWDTTEREAALFIYSRFAEPYHSLIVKDKSNTQLFVEPITSRLKLKIETPFIFSGIEQKRTRCFLFDSKDACNRVGKLLEGIIQSSVQVHPQPQSNYNGGHAGIFSMLANAQESFNSVAGHRGTAQPSKHFQKLSANTNDASSSVMNFFAAAQPASTDIPAFKRMLSEPFHVNQIEKHQRNITPLEKKGLPTQKSNTIPHHSANTFQPIPSPNLTKFPFANARKPSNRINAAFTESSNTTHVNQSEVVQRSTQNIRKNNDRSGREAPNRTKQPILMSPNMFLATENENGNSVLPPSITNEPSVSSNTTQMKTSEDRPEPLTTSQLLQAVSHLIKTDNEFVKKLHEAYLQSFNEMLTL